MASPAPLTWWPERILRRYPVQKVFVCGRQLHPPLYSHIVNFPRLEIPLRGCYDNQIESGGEIVKVGLKPGTALFAAPNCWNLPLWQRNVKLMSLLFGKKQLGISIVTAHGSDPMQLKAQKYSAAWPLTGPLQHILEAMAAMQGRHDSQPAMADLARALIYCTRDLFQNPVEHNVSRSQKLMESVCVYLQNHYQYDITRNSVAGQFAVTPNHLSRLFQTHGSMTFGDYLTHVRIDRAKYLLRNYDLKLDDISIRCGYRDTPYFCRVFKRLTKCTPAEYRSACRDREHSSKPPA